MTVVAAEFGVTLGTIAHLEIERVDPGNGLYKIFVSNLPHGANRPERCVAIVFTEAGGGIVTDRHVKQICLVERIVGMAEEGEETVLAPGFAHAEGALDTILQPLLLVIGLTRRLGIKTIIFIVNAFMTHQEG